MEDFIQILIWLFIIFSFFASFFKKKNKEAPRPEQRRETTQRVEQPETHYSQVEKEEDFDVLKEIEGLFKQPASNYPESQDVKVEKYEDKVEKADKYINDHYQDEWHQRTPSEHVFETDWDRRMTQIEKQKAKVDPKIQAQAKKFEAVLNKMPEQESLMRKRMLKGIKNPDKLREYILFSEIIGRPKSLRR